MSSRILRASLLSILILQILHLPLPCPDLDGECRGTPIVSLADANAWHVLIAGVMPNHDIDRGPFRSDDSAPKRTPSDSPYGDLAVTSSVASAVMSVLSRSWELSICEIAAKTMTLGDVSLFASRRFQFLDDSWTLDARTLRARVCVWRI